MGGGTSVTPNMRSVGAAPVKGVSSTSVFWKTHGQENVRVAFKEREQREADSLIVSLAGSRGFRYGLDHRFAPPSEANESTDYAKQR